MRWQAVTLIAAGTLVVAAPRVSAQRTRLTLSGFPIAFTTPTGADFSNGFIVSAPVTFLVDGQSGNPHQQRTTTVTVRCALPCPTNGGPKPLATLKWRRADLGVWNTLTTNDALVEQRTMLRNSTNDPWSNQLFWRFDLDWFADSPGAATTFNIIFTLTVTVP